MASVWIQQSGVQKWLDAPVVQAGGRAHRSRKVNRLHQWIPRPLRIFSDRA
jgi:hypothetical protein